MKKPEIKILPLAKNSPVHFVLIDGDAKYKCLSKDRAEAIEGMIDALIEAKVEIEFLDKEYNKSRVWQKIEQALEKAGVTEL